MVLGMSLVTFTALHVLISLVAILSGVVVVKGVLTGRRMNRWTAVFFVTNIATSITGFFFPFKKFGPPHFVGMIALVILAVGLLARYRFHLAGSWSRTYVVTTLAALYLNVFVGIVQAFQKSPSLHAVAPHQTESPFVVTQLAVVVFFVLLGLRAASSLRTTALRTA
jgi:hypothetical protein